MIESRVCAKASRLSGEINIPLSSGPRCRNSAVIVRKECSNDSARGDPLQEIMPAMPHMYQSNAEKCRMCARIYNSLRNSVATCCTTLAQSPGFGCQKSVMEGY